MPTSSTIREIETTLRARLRSDLPRRAWSEWGQYLVLIAVREWKDGSANVLVGVPPVGRMIAAACDRLPKIRESLAQNRVGVSLCVYPDEYQAGEVLRRFGRISRIPEWPPRRSKGARD